MPTMTHEQIRTKLATLDPNNEDQWTGDGLPAMDLFPGVKRAEVTAAAPRFSRATLKDGTAFEAIVEKTKPEAPKPPEDPDTRSYTTAPEYEAWCKAHNKTPNPVTLDQLRRQDVTRLTAEVRSKQILDERKFLAENADKLGPRRSPLDAAYQQRRPTDRPPIISGR